jgi:hypothetical protein
MHFPYQLTSATIFFQRLTRFNRGHTHGATITLGVKLPTHLKIGTILIMQYLVGWFLGQVLILEQLFMNLQSEQLNKYSNFHRPLLTAKEDQYLELSPEETGLQIPYWVRPLMIQQ